jgi:hypothetical protein
LRAIYRDYDAGLHQKHLQMALCRERSSVTGFLPNANDQRNAVGTSGALGTVIVATPEAENGFMVCTACNRP